MATERLAARAAAVIVSVAIAAAGAELALRMALPRLPIAFLIYLHPDVKDRSPETWVRVRDYLPFLNIRKEDPDTGWNFKPDMRSAGTNEEGERYDRTTSAEGFFTPDLPDPHTRQLIVIGDSFLSTFYVTQPIAWAMKANLGVPVYNLAVAGWGPESYAAAYRKFAAGRRHDLVVVFTFMNDIMDVYNWNAWKAEESSESFLTWIQRTTAQTDAVNRGTTWFDSHLVLWNLIKFPFRSSSADVPHGVQPISAPILAADATKLERFAGGPAGSFQLQLGRGQVFTDNDPSYFFPGGNYYPYMQGYFESLARLKGLVEQKGARMVLVWIPSKERVYLPLLPPARQAAYVTNHTHDIGGLEAVVSRFAALEGLSYLDLTAPLTEHARRNEKLYFTVDGHLNSHGNEVVGTIVADYLKALPAHPPAPVLDGPPLYVRHGAVDVEHALTLAAATFRASIVQPAGSGFVARGKAESQYGYLMQWPEASVVRPQWLIARGVVRRGGVTLGLLKENKWALQFNIDHRGRFDVALPVTEPGAYMPLIANAIRDGSLDTDVEITTLGWATAR